MCVVHSAKIVAAPVKAGTEANRMPELLHSKAHELIPFCHVMRADRELLYRNPHGRLEEDIDAS